MGRNLSRRAAPGILSPNARSVTKRAIDLVLAGPLLLLTLPTMAIAAIVIKIIDRGPAFYAQEREGLHGETFRLWKLRTMYTDADERLTVFLEEHPERRQEWEHIFKLNDDPRVLPVIGNLLRRTSIDELPNLINVLRGELSIVGPRPFPGYHLDAFSDSFRALRASVRPGITGLWQLGRGGLDVQQRTDSYYVENWSLGLDLRIIVRTIPAVLLARKKQY